MEWECHSCGHKHRTISNACEKCGTKPEIVLNVWRCAHCGQNEIPGTIIVCPSCKAEKGKDIESKVDVAQHIQGDIALELARGQWLYCAYCDKQVPPVDPQTGHSHKKCPTCHGPLSEATDEIATELVSEVEAGQYRKEKTKAIGQADRQNIAPSEKNKKSTGKSKIANSLVGTIILITIVAIGLYFLFKPRKETLLVVSQAWERAVEIEKFGTVVEQNWLNQMPAAAQSKTCSPRVHSHKQVPSGTETYKERVVNGQKCAEYGYEKKGGVSVKQCTKWEKQYREVTKTKTKYKKEPVYEQWCSYSIEKWYKDRVLKEIGTDATPLKWPDVKISDPKIERVGKRIELYNLIANNKEGKAIAIPCISLQQWEKYKAGSKVMVEISGTEKKIIQMKAE